jgi:catechol 2,3-dioxygenase-like lactoylglutathione lyase family enzyme
MRLGAFSISLSVKDLQASREFYGKLGFEDLGGDAANGYLILKNGDAVIGLFQGMFEQNILTFNPKWDQSARQVDGDDVREIAAKLEAEGVELMDETNLDGEGPASFVMLDPDGNPVLVDQHVA